MLDWFGYFIGIVAALWAIALMAFPELIDMGEAAKKKRFNVKHWGAYEGDTTANDDKDSIEIQIPARKRREVVGSRTYEAGRGISFRS
ncbi:MAG: hypothetical protein K2W82_09245 [Candidatus Obscuribacterales bacterium]|nr:hypothetical protein [Candidatus Obscuribacterales bacterium]